MRVYLNFEKFASRISIPLAVVAVYYQINKLAFATVAGKIATILAFAAAIIFASATAAN